MSHDATNTLADRLTLEKVGPGTYRRDLDRTFWGHQAQFGGYVQSLAMRAAQIELDVDDQPPMSVTVHFLRPFGEGELNIVVDVARRGRTMSNATVELTCGGKLAGLGLISFGTHRDIPDFVDAPMPDVAPFDPAEEPEVPNLGIPTHEWFDYWPRLGPVRRDRALEVAITGGWVRPVEPWPIDASVVTMIHDLWTPAAYSRWREPVVAMTADITAHHREPLPPDGLTPGDPLLVVLTTKASRHGFVDEDSEVWTADGRLLGHSRQVRYANRYA